MINKNLILMQLEIEKNQIFDAINNFHQLNSYEKKALEDYVINLLTEN